jgi:hypothetical protein
MASTVFTSSFRPTWSTCNATDGPKCKPGLRMRIEKLDQILQGYPDGRVNRDDSIGDFRAGRTVFARPTTSRIESLLRTRTVGGGCRIALGWFWLWGNPRELEIERIWMLRRRITSDPDRNSRPWTKLRVQTSLRARSRP